MLRVVADFFSRGEPWNFWCKSSACWNAAQSVLAEANLVFTCSIRKVAISEGQEGVRAACQVLGVLGQSESNQHWSKNWKAWGYPLVLKYGTGESSIQDDSLWYTMMFLAFLCLRSIAMFDFDRINPRKDSQHHPSMTRAKLVTSSIHFNKKAWSSMLGKTIRFVENNWHLRSSQLGRTPDPASIVTWTMPWAQAQLMTWSFGNLYIDIFIGGNLWKPRLRRKSSRQMWMFRCQSVSA